MKPAEAMSYIAQQMIDGRVLGGYSAEEKAQMRAVRIIAHKRDNYKNNKTNKYNTPSNIPNSPKRGKGSTVFPKGQQYYRYMMADGGIGPNESETRLMRADQIDQLGYTPEMEEIKAKAIADGIFMKAPNGERTKLTERQWLQVRTKAFKKWFGDWEVCGS